MRTRQSYIVPLAGGRRLDLGQRTLVMGVINVTPDSFAEAAASIDPSRALERALEAQEQRRRHPRPRRRVDAPGRRRRSGGRGAARGSCRCSGRSLAGVRVPISIDTRKAAVARAALDEGAAIVNDISGLRYDAALGRVVAAAGAGLVLMHMRGTPRDMYGRAAYARRRRRGDRASWRRAWNSPPRAGVARDAVIVDPGIGFAKQADAQLRDAGAPRGARRARSADARRARRASRSCAPPSATGRRWSGTGRRPRA